MPCVWSAREVKGFCEPHRNPASRRHGGWSPQKPHGRNGTLPGLLPRAASRLVTGLSRASCRDASGLAVLMSTGCRAGLPGLSRPAALRPGGQARAHHRPGPSDRHLLPLPGPLSPAWRAAGAGLTPDPGRRPNCGSPGSARQPAAAVGCRVSRAPGGWVGQGTSHARGNGRPPGRWAPGCLVGCPACSRGRGQRAGVSFRLCSCGEAAKAALGVGCCRIARGRQGAAASQ
jgi:hypothetical protein